MQYGKSKMMAFLGNDPRKTLVDRMRGAVLGWLISLVAGMVIAVPTIVMAQERAIFLGRGGPVVPIQIRPGFTLTLTTNVAFTDIVVGNSAIADVFPLSDTSVYVQGNAPGTTNISYYDSEKRLLGTTILKVAADFGELRSVIERAVPSARVDVENLNGRIRLSGTVKDTVDRDRILEIAQQYSDNPAENTIVNAIRVTDPQQVQLDVRILEVSRNVGRELGVNLTGTNDGVTRLRTGGSISGQQPFGSFVGNLLQIAGTEIDIVINALEGRGLARRLANPTLVTTSGVEANFVVGGEVPISTAVIGENGSVANETDYREYGVRLNFRPVVMDNSQISLRIRPEVSDIDTSVTVNGQPAFISRKADTTVTLRDGQSFAIAGLLQVNNERNVKAVPWIGQIPILGTLFRSTAFQKNETDLVILVTPRLVQPGVPNRPLVSPLEQTRSSNDVELFLMGMLEVNKDMIRGYQTGKGIIGPYGHIIDLDFDDALVTKK